MNRVDRETAAQIEHIEAEAWRSLYESVSSSDRVDLGISTHEVAGGVVTLASSVDVLAFNRAMAIGLAEPVEEPHLDELVSIFERSGASRCFVQVSPFAEPETIGERLGELGLVKHNRWVKLVREVDHPPDATTEFEIEEIGAVSADQFADVVIEAFDWPAQLAPLVAAGVGRSGWRYYVAREGDRVVGTAVSYLRDEYGWFSFASTSASVRGRGVQSALVRRRLVDAAAAGCVQVVLETSEPRPDNLAQSYKNVIRLGFEKIYSRQNYLWTRS